MSKWIRKDDKVVVITGNDKGSTGVVLGRQGDRVIVQGVNVRKRHMKRRSQTVGPQIIEKECPIHVSNVSFCNSEGKACRIKVRESGGKKELYYIDSGKEIVHRQVNK